MGTSYNQRMYFWEDVRAELGRGCKQLTPTIQCNRRQVRVVVDAYWVMLALWSDVCGTLPRKVITSTVRWLRHTPVSAFCGLMKRCDEVLIDEYRYSLHPDPVPRFKHEARQLHIDGMPVVDTLLNSIGECLRRSCADDVETFKAWHQVFCFITRLNIPGRPDLAEEGLEAYVQKELDLDQVQYTAPELSLVKWIVQEWFPNTVDTYEALYGDWVPKHGNGSVAEGNLDIADKYLAFKTDTTLEYLDLYTGGLGNYPRTIPGGLSRTSRLMFVPKNVFKERSISMEPAILQFYQQGCMRSLVRYIHSHPYLRRRIDLHDSSRNAFGAWAGSFDGSMATIDLSAASDSVSWRLVRLIFGDTPLWPMLETTRSTRVLLPTGEVMRQRIFAPMGSALCFPVECIVFAAITEASIRLGLDAPDGDSRCGSTSRANSMRKAYAARSEYTVYGDDIVVEEQHVRDVVMTLQRLAFQVNSEKSYWDDGEHLHYRESCGGEYMLGYEVTPVRIPRRFCGMDVDGLRRHSSQYEGLIDLANSCFSRFPLVRNIIIKSMNALPKRFRPLFVAVGDNGGIISTEPTNYMLYQREFVDPITTPGPKSMAKPWYQRTRYRHGKAKPESLVMDPEVEDIRLYECLRAMSTEGTRDNSRDTFIRREDRGPTAGRLTSGWTI